MMTRHRVVIRALAFFVLSPVAAAGDERIVENYIETVKAFERLAQEQNIELVEGEQLKDVAAFALNNMAKNNFVPVGIEPDAALDLYGGEFRAFLGFWSWLPVVPKTEDQRNALRKVRRLLSANAYEVALATLTVEGASITSVPPVYGRRFVQQLERPVNDFGVHTVFSDTTMGAAHFSKFRPAYKENVGFYQRLLDGLLDGQVGYPQLVNFGLIERYVRD